MNLGIGLSCALPLYLWRRARVTKGSSPLAAAASGALFLALLLVPTPAVSGQAAAIEPEAVVTRFYEAYRAADVSAMLAVYAPEAVFIDIAQRHHVEGEAALREFLARLVGLHLAMDVEIERQVVAGNTVVVELAYVGTLSGTALHQATGLEGCTDTTYRIPVTTWFDLQGDRITRQTDFLDLATLQEVKARASGAGG